MNHRKPPEGFHEFAKTMRGFIGVSKAELEKAEQRERAASRRKKRARRRR